MSVVPIKYVYTNNASNLWSIMWRCIWFTGYKSII